MSSKENVEVTGMRIAISGLSGCGNTTASGAVARRLRFRSINYTFRDLAKEEKISLQKLHHLAITEFPKYDLLLDKKLMALARKQRNCVVGSRLALWFDSPKLCRVLGVKPLPLDLKVWLEAPLAVRAERIAKREGISFGTALEQTRARDNENASRYSKLYGIELSGTKADLIVDAEKNDAKRVADIIVKEARKRARKETV